MTFAEIKEAAGEYLPGAISTLVGAGFVIAGIAAAQGPGECRTAFANQAPSSTGQTVEVGTMWGRTLDGHWIAGLVFQPKDLDSDALTVVCHFAGKSYTVPRIETFTGDQRTKLKDISSNNIWPWNWAL